MHPNPVFRKMPDEMNLAFARERGFGMLALNADPCPLIAHIPFLLAENGTEVDFHLVRSNPILSEISEPKPAKIAISGPDGYISPDWYQLPDQVPTWNYVAIHLRGTVSRLTQDHLRDMLDRLSSRFETELLPKHPWTSAKMPAETLDRMMRMIVPCRMKIDAVQGTWKLAQNKPETARQAAANQVGAYGIGQETAILAALMRAPPQS